MSDDTKGNSPFAMVYRALWECALAHPFIRRDVREGNRIRFDVNELQVVKPNVQAADLPELMLVPTGMNSNLFDTSSSSRVTRMYTWGVASGDYKYALQQMCLLSDVEWYLFTCMHAWKEKLGALEYNAERFVKRVNLMTGALGLSDPEKNRNIQGWTGVWSIEVEMHFRSATLKALLDNCEE